MIDNQQKRRTSKIIVIVLIIILAFFILNSFRLNVKNFFYVVSNPFQKLFWRAGNNASDFLCAFLKIKDLKNNNNQFLLENQKLLLEVSILEDLKKENQILREALEIGLQKDFKMVLARVISKDMSEDSILINKGSEDEISKDMPVINQQKVLFGRVSEVYRNFSRVMLITSKDSIFDSKTQNKEIYGVIKGKGNFNLYFDLISREAELKEGDVLVTSALGGKFPQNLLIGEVERVKKEDTKPFQTADIRPFFDLKKTDNLFIVTDF